MEDTAKKKNPGLAAIASFFIPGLGQIYSGEIRKGIEFYHNWSDIWFHNINSVMATSYVRTFSGIWCIVPSILDVQYI